MKATEKRQFMEFMTDAMAFYRQDMSTFALSVWWMACERYELEQVSKALTAHVMDPERGQFPPKPADIVRVLQGTHTDRGLISWGKVLEAMQRVGAYSSVCFDDPAIHAAIEDMGGWPKLCRSTNDELPHVQRAFCQTYKAYVGRGDFSYPARLVGVHEAENAIGGHRSAPAVLIGDPVKAKQIQVGGSMQPKTQITHVGDAVGIRRIGWEAA